MVQLSPTEPAPAPGWRSLLSGQGESSGPRSSAMTSVAETSGTTALFGASESDFRESVWGPIFFFSPPTSALESCGFPEGENLWG